MANSMPKRAAESPHEADDDADALLAAAFHPPLGEGALEFFAQEKCGGPARDEEHR